MKVFVTGHRGYIGCHVVDLLKAAGHSVTGCDLNLFDGCGWEPAVPPDRELVRDVRTLKPAELEGHDWVLHLAAISNDPMGELDPELTLSVNRDGSVRVAEAAKEAGVERFVLAGSCSVYGKAPRPAMREDDPLAPLSTYARSKVEAEALIAPLADDGFCPVFARNATAFGHSPMLRVDLVANNLLACAVATGSIRIMSDGSPWRPLVHCRDIARALIALAETPAEVVSGRAVNVGADDANYQVRDIADLVQELVPAAEIVYTGEVGDDPRSYRVGFDLLGDILPGFALEHPLRAGMEELSGALRRHGFSRADWEGPRFVRLRTLHDRIELLGAPAPV